MQSVVARTIFGFLVACLVLFLNGTLAHAQGAWEFGAQTLLVTADSASPLMQPAFGAPGLLSADILASVGGVDLEGVAVIDPAPNDLAISYHPENPDGQRLQITVWGATYDVTLPDWELKPIALLADSPYSADISLFGNGPDPDHFYYIQYHPALKNTLLGLRLLQADMQLMDPQDMSGPPKFDGKIILGLNEQLPSAADAAQAVKILSELMSVEPIQSWILTDINTRTTLSKSGTDGLDLTASPYYYFWTTPYERLDNRKSMLEALLSDETDPAKAAKMKTDLTAVEAQLSTFNTGNPPNAPEPVTEATDALKSHPDVLNALNPLVWNAVMDTAEFSALFRYYKAHYPVGWSNFLGSLQGVTPSPVIDTPTQWARQ